MRPDDFNRSNPTTQWRKGQCRTMLDCPQSPSLSHNNKVSMTTPDLSQATDQARQLALTAIARRCQTDLFYLCKHILGYDLMTELTHGELCSLTQTLTGQQSPSNPPHRPRTEEEDGTPA